MTGTDADAVAKEIVELWAYLAVNPCNHLQSLIDRPGNCDLLQVRLEEWFRRLSADALQSALEQRLPLPGAALPVREIMTACNEAFAPIAERVAAVAAAGEDVVFKVATTAISEAKPLLLQQVSLVAERAVARG